MKTMWLVYSRFGLQNFGFQTPNKVNFITCCKKGGLHEVYTSKEEAEKNKDKFFDQIAEFSALYEIKGIKDLSVN